MKARLKSQKLATRLKMRLSFSIVFLALASILNGSIANGQTQPTQASTNDSGLYFHWGDTNGNATLLRAGGAPADQHFQDLSRGESASLNEAVLAQTRTWYEDTRRPDLGGAGFYMSPDLLNSRGFGNDLLIVEVENRSGRPVTITDQDIKTKADAALNAGNFSDLPLIAHYNLSTGWRLILRDLNPQEKQTVRVVFRVPKAEDVPLIWTKLENEASTDYTLSSLARIANELTGAERASQSSRISVTRAADIVFRRLLFDHAPEFLAKFIAENRNSLLGLARTEKQEKLESILSAFHKIIPGDQRTIRLTRQHVQIVLSQTITPGSLRSEKLLRYIADSSSLLEPEDARKAYNWILIGFDRDILQGDLNSLAKLTSAYLRHVSSQERLTARRVFSDFALRSIVSTATYLETRALTSGVLGAEMGANIVDQAFLAETRRLVAAYSMPHNRQRETRRPTPFNAGDSLIAQAEELSALRRTTVSATRFDSLVRSFIDMVFSSSPPNGVQDRIGAVALELFDKVTDPALRARLRDRAQSEIHNYHSRIQRLKEQERPNPDTNVRLTAAVRRLGRSAGITNVETMRTSDLIFRLAGDQRFASRVRNIQLQLSPREISVSDSGPLIVFFSRSNRTEALSAQLIESRFNAVLAEFPTEARALSEEIKTLQLFHPELPVQWARLEQRANQIANLDLDPVAGARAAYKQMRSIYQTTNNESALNRLIDFESFQRIYVRMNQNVVGHSAYSELSRTFALVDAPFVSEDLRRMNANRPFERFNETLNRGQQVETQPAWENFNSAWRMMVDALWLREPVLDNPRIGWVDGKLEDVHGRLVTTQVDGTRLDQNSHWDRSKYLTYISDADWSDWDLERNRSQLERYFIVESAEGGFNLRFRRNQDLLQNVPAIRRNNVYRQGTRVLLNFIRRQVFRLDDPVHRASRVLYLMTRLHPFENGNGRFGRLWATVELMRAGHPMPMGFPTHDFFLNQRQVELEVKKSLQLGRMWAAMVENARQQNIAPDDFFQRVYKGSALEGLSLISIRSASELSGFVQWLEGQTEAPHWARQVTVQFEAELRLLNQQGKQLRDLNEAERFNLGEKVWRDARTHLEAQRTPGLPPRGGSASSSDLRCSALFR